nr:unnamed protein product [Callosobruchus analis]
MLPENLSDCVNLQYVKSNYCKKCQNTNENVEERFLDASEVMSPCSSMECKLQNCEFSFIKKELLSKDRLIANLEARISDQCELINLYKATKGTNIENHCDRSSDAPSKNSTQNHIASSSNANKNSVVPCTNPQTVRTTVKHNTRVISNVPQPLVRTHNPIKANDVAESIAEILPKANHQSTGGNNSKEEFTEVVHKKQTTADDVKNYLCQMFPEVKCEQLNSQYPNYYSSFKVTIYKDHLEQATEPSIWPNGACKKNSSFNELDTQIDFDKWDDLCPQQLSDFLCNKVVKLKNPKTCFSAFHINIQGITDKTDKLSLFLDDYPFDVLCFSEHFLNQGCLNQIHIPGYMLACYYCRSVRERGGVCIFIKNNIKFKPLCFKEFNTERDSEFCGLDLGECVIVCTYRSSCCPDRRPYLRNLEALLSKLYNKPNTKKVIIMGDVNFHFNVPSHDLTQLLNLIESFGLNQTIFKPTRNHNCLDNILTDFSDNNFKSDIFDASLSDHSGQFILVNNKLNSSKSEKLVIKISVGGLNRLRESISNHDWSSFMGKNQDVDFLGRALTDFYTSSIKNNFPVLIKSHQNSAPLVNWFTDKLKHTRKQLEIMKSISNIIECPRYNDFTKFLSKEYENEIRLSKQQAYDSLFLNAKNKAKVAWKIINTERNKKGMSVSDSMLSSELLNTFFTGVAKGVITKMPSLNRNEFLPKTPPTSASSFFLGPVSEPEVYSAFFSLNNSPSVDIFEVNYKILANTIDLIIGPLTSLINKCFTTGVFPTTFKISRVLPL